MKPRPIIETVLFVLQNDENISRLVPGRLGLGKTLTGALVAL
jgi:hypothetical protein